ncbi:LemA family protein [Cocleimonas flava]|uniref:LemA protein n=1 Tax=Cocleimonas flava TaxID=634765 RepID=A0A4R1ETZ5_9GAMM|nr:LemA family protein [Cocleimonas flava]TCJ83294.1 LemA protein [Cocleimonas flava]
MSKFGMVILAAITLFIIFGVGVYNRIVSGDEGVTASWSEVVNQYQRRADLIPNLVSTVKGFAAQEKDVLTSVVEARAKATSVQITPETLNDPAAFSQFSQAQSQLTGALSRLLVTVERYPDLKSDKNFLELQTQLEGTENRITVARKRYIDAVKDYNLTVRKFPGNMIASLMGYSTKQNFTVENEDAIAAPPKVDFNTAPATN